MGIEDLLKRLGDSLDANTAAVTKQNDILAKMAGASGGAPASTGAKGGAKTTATKPKDEPKGPSVQDAAEKVTAYLKAGATKEDRDAAKANVGRIIEHFGAERFTAIPLDKMAEALDMLNDFEEGRTPEALGGDEGGEDESLV